MVGSGGGDFGALLVGEKLPVGIVVRAADLAVSREILRIITVGGVGIHHAVLVHGGREDRELGAASVFAVVCGDHADGPEVALLVMEGAAVSGADFEAAGLEGQRVVLGIDERSGGAVGDVDAVGVGNELKTDGGVLQIILAVMLGHPRTFDPGKLLGTVLAATAEDGVDDVLGLARLEAVIFDVAEEQRNRFGFFLEGLGVEFDDLERHDLRPAEIQVQAVAVGEQVGIAVAVAAELADLLPGAGFGINRLVDVAVVHRAANELAVEFHDGDDAGGIVGGVDIGPVLEIRGVPVASAVRDEQIVVVFVDEDDGLAAANTTLMPDEDVEGVSEGVFRLRRRLRVRRKTEGQGACHCKRDQQFGMLHWGTSINLFLIECLVVFKVESPDANLYHHIISRCFVFVKVQK